MRSNVAIEQIEQDGFGKHFEVMIAEHLDKLIGFAV
jgi:hypothetical protein